MISEEVSGVFCDKDMDRNMSKNRKSNVDKCTYVILYCLSYMFSYITIGIFNGIGNEAAEGITKNIAGIFLWYEVGLLVFCMVATIISLVLIIKRNKIIYYLIFLLLTIFILFLIFGMNKTSTFENIMLIFILFVSNNFCINERLNSEKIEQQVKKQDEYDKIVSLGLKGLCFSLGFSVFFAILMHFISNVSTELLIWKSSVMAIELFITSILLAVIMKFAQDRVTDKNDAFSKRILELLSLFFILYIIITCVDEMVQNTVLSPTYSVQVIQKNGKKKLSDKNLIQDIKSGKIKLEVVQN